MCHPRVDFLLLNYEMNFSENNITFIWNSGNYAITEKVILNEKE